MKDYWLKAEFFKRKIEDIVVPSMQGVVLYSELSPIIYIPKSKSKYYRRLQKCKLLRTMYAEV